MIQVVWIFYMALLEHVGLRVLILPPLFMLPFVWLFDMQGWGWPAQVAVIVGYVGVLMLNTVVTLGHGAFWGSVLTMRGLIVHGKYKPDEKDADRSNHD